MNQHTKEELITELQELQQKYNSLKAKYQKDIIVQNQVKENISIINKQYKAILQSAISGFWRVNLLGRIKEVNKAYCKMSGFSEQELLTMHVPELDANEDNEATVAHIQKVIELGYDRFESKHRRKDGSIYDVEISAQYLNINGGQIVGFVNDITKRKLAEKALRKSEAKYRNLYKNTPVMLHSIDLQGRLLSVSNYWLKVMGYKRDEVIGVESTQFLTEASKKYAAEVVLPAFFKNGYCYDIPYQFVKKSGEIIDVLLSAVSEKNNSQEASHSLAVIIDITDLKKNEKALLENEARLKEAQKIGQMGHWNLDLIKNKLTWSDETYRIFGLKPLEFKATYEAFLDKIHPDDRKKVNKAYVKSLKTKKPYHIEHRLLLKTGELKYVIEQCKTEFDKQGKPLNSIGTVHDITERKKAEKELMIAKQKAEETEANFRKLSNLTFEGIIIHENGVAIDVNRSFSKLVGYSKSQILGNNLFDLVIPEKYHATVLNKIKTGYTKPYEVELQKKDGSLLPVEIIAKNIKTQENKTGRVVAVRDISLRKKAEKEITKLLTAVEQSANIIIITDTSGDIEYTNPKFTEITGYSAQEVAGQNPRILNAGTQPKEYYAEMWQTITAGKIWRGELNNKKKNGDYFWEYTTITPIKNEAAEITNFLAIKEDITVLRENQRKLQIQNKELIIAKEKAEESDRLKTAFLTNMSHEIRTPMNGIMGFANLLKEPMLSDEDQHDFIDNIVRSGERMLNIIEDLMDISEIESGQMEVSISETNINKQIEYIYAFFKPEVDKKGMQLFFNNPFSEKESIIYTDNEKIYAILTNLIKNAIKYSDKGFIKFGYEKKGKYLQFFVKDTGIGFSGEEKEFIFNRFRQADESHCRNYEGAGLGLSISKAYVEMLGGKIWVESEEGKGSIFYFTIPYNAAMEEKIGSNVVSVKEANKPIKDLHILIAEDDEISGMLATRVVKEFGKEILIARTGVEAIEICQDNPALDLILMDIKMPEMDGYEAIRQIRKYNKEVVIIAQSALAYASDREKAIEVGCNAFISKPINLNDLHELLEKHFKF